MILIIKRFLFFTTYYSLLFLILMIGIQNSNQKTKIYFLKYETIELPLGFILGTSLISGCMTASLLPLKRNLIYKD